MNLLKKHLLLVVFLVAFVIVEAIYCKAAVDRQSIQAKSISNDQITEHTEVEEETVLVETTEEKQLHGPYVVVRVVDGDTAVIKIDNEDKKVRFIGVDTPESVHPDKEKNTEEGKTASDYTKALLTEQEVYLEYDVSPEDRFGRILAYVYLSDKETMVQELLLKNGMATTMTIQPNSKYADYFSQLQKEARETGGQASSTKCTPLTPLFFDCS